VKGQKDGKLFLSRPLDGWIRAEDRSLAVQTFWRNEKCKMEKEKRKMQAVKMIKQGLSVGEVSRDLGVSATVIRNWKRKLAEEGEQAFPVNERLPADQYPRLTDE